MAKPFQITLIPGATAPATKPGWHKRALAAARRHTPATAPQKGDPRADAKAADYARWLAARDGIELPAREAEIRVDWQPTQHGYRPRAVAWYPARQGYRPAARGMAQPAVEPLLRIELPHWDYEAPAAVESTLLEWSAPVVTEVPGDAGAVMAPLAADTAHIEPLAVCPALGLPCKPDCGFRPTCGIPVPPVEIAGASPPEGIQPVQAPEAISEPRTVTAVCLSHRARAHLLRRVGAVPHAAGYAAKGGAFSLTLSEARSAADVKCVRLIGMPRKVYTRRAVAPFEGIATPPEVIRAIPSATFIPGGAMPGPIVYHAAPKA